MYVDISVDIPVPWSICPIQLGLMLFGRLDLFHTSIGGLALWPNEVTGLVTGDLPIASMGLAYIPTFG